MLATQWTHCTVCAQTLLNLHNYKHVAPAARALAGCYMQYTVVSASKCERNVHQAIASRVACKRPGYRDRTRHSVHCTYACVIWATERGDLSEFLAARRACTGCQTSKTRVPACARGWIFGQNVASARQGARSASEMQSCWLDKCTGVHLTRC